MSYFTAKKYSAMKDETVFGEYVAPTVGDITFPINDVELVTPDLGITEYGRPANGKFTRGRYIAGKQMASVAWTTFMMESTAGNLEVSPAFESAGFHLDETLSEPRLIFDGNPNCQTYSMDIITLGCYDPVSLSVAGNAWSLRGLKSELTLGAESVTAPILVTMASVAGVEAHNQTDTASVPVPTFEDKGIDIFLGASVSLNGVDLNVQSWSFTTGNSNNTLGDASKSGGTGKTEIIDVDPKLTVTAVVDANVANLWGKTINNENVGDVVVTGQYYTYTFGSNDVVNYSEADAEGTLVLTLELSPKDDVTIAKV